MMKQIMDFSFKYGKWVIFASVLLTIVSTYNIAQIKVDNSIETLSVDNDPKVILLGQAEEAFGGNEFVVISFKGDDIFSPRVLSMIDAITMDIEKIENVESVLSLTNAMVVKKDESGLGMDKLLSESDRAEKDVHDLKQKTISNKLYQKLIYSSDGNATSIIAWMVPLENDDNARWRVVSEIKDAVNTHKDNRKFHFYGLPIYQEIIYKIMIQDQFVLPAILSLLMGCILWGIYRSIWFSFLPFLVIGLSIFWSMGFFAMEGNTLDVVTFIIPSVLLIVSLCAAIHILSEYRDACTQNVDRVEAVKATVSHIGIPIMLTSLTTAIGFFSLTTSGIRCIRNFGAYAGLGVIFAFGVSVCLLPLVMARLPISKKKGGDRLQSVLEALLTRLADWLPRHKLHVFAVTIIALTVCLAGALKLKPNMVILGTIKTEVAQDIIEAQRFVDVEMAGSAESNILLKGDGPGSLLTPEALKLIDRNQQRLLEVPGTLKGLSITDYVKQMNQVLNDDDPMFYRIPDSQKKIDAIMMLYSMNEEMSRLKKIINEDGSVGRIRLFTFTAADSTKLQEYYDQIEAVLKEGFGGAEVSGEHTARGNVWGNMVRSLIMEMVKTFSLAFFIVFCLMFTIFRSWRLGVISSIVNIIPIIVTLGCMGWLRIDLNMATAAMPSIAIGIAVDDTIHFIWRFKEEFRRHQTYPDALVHTMKSVGKPILITTILICTGFAMLVFSRLTVYTEFGLLLSLTVAVALVSDLFVAPVLLMVFKPFKAAANANGTFIDLELPEKEIAMGKIRVSKDR